MTALENSSHSPRYNLIAGEIGTGTGTGNGQSQGSPSAIGPLKLQTVARGAAAAMAAFTRNSFALIGLSVLFMAIALVAHPEFRQTGKSHLMDWLQDSHEATAAGGNRTGAEPDESDAVERATAAHPHSLPGADQGVVA